MEKYLPPCLPPSLPPFLFPLSQVPPSTPPAACSYITLVCEHSSQHSFSGAHSSNTNRPAPLALALRHWLSAARSLLGIGWVMRRSAAAACQPMWTFCPTDTLSHCRWRGRREARARSRLVASQLLRWNWKMLRLPPPCKTFPLRAVVCIRKLATLHNSPFI